MIERFQADDWERWRAIRLRSLELASAAFCASLEESLNRSDEDWRAMLERDGVATFVSVSDAGDDVGMVTMAPYDDVIGLFGMWVEQDARKSGVARALIKAGIAWARQEGFKTVLLDVGDENTAAIALYESFGFQPTGVVGQLPAPREHLREHQRILSL